MKTKLEHRTRRTLAALALATLGAVIPVGSAATARPPYFRSDGSELSRVRVLRTLDAGPPCSKWTYLQSKCHMVQGQRGKQRPIRHCYNPVFHLAMVCPRNNWRPLRRSQAG